MRYLVSTDIEKARIANWIMQAKAVDKNPTWTERRQAIEFGGHTYLVSNGQVFQCAHCGHYDPEWSAVKVIEFFQEHMNGKLVEIEITCSVAVTNE